jgi:signal transduction histidine kinase
VLQDLSAVRMKLEGDEVAEVEPARRESAGAIAGVIAAIRRVVDDLRPAALSSTSLAEAIAGHARIVTWAQGVELDLRLDGAGIPEWAARDAYRIVQEALANALRHARPKRVSIRFAEADGETALEIEDDGPGFDPATAMLGSGVLGMRERAAALGGDLEIRAGMAGGTLVRLTLPLRPPGAVPST